MSDLLARLQGALGGAYHLERELGGGGMSRVFVAEETALGRRVVLKVLPPELGAGLSVDRFRREIQLAASLHHPNIVPLLTAGEADGLLYYTMPLIDGDSLRTRLAREGELPVGEVVRLLRDVVDALACAHERGVVHRDIKPDNVLLSRHHAMVTDFGVAKALSEATGRSSLTSAGVALGTPAYMAPEQATADPHVDHRADIYAVGALAYEMLAGRPPFVAPTPQAVLAAQVTQAAEPVTRFRPSVPPALAALVMRCLEKRPADRWQTADELLHQFEAMATPSGGMAPTGVTAAAPTSAPASAPAGPAARRHRAGYLVLGLVLALAAAWGVGHYRGSRTGTDAATGPQTVVVLPFENLGRPEDGYFADGITEEITNRLTGIGGLRVIARSSAKQYKDTRKTMRQIGDELGVAYVLEGTVRWERAGDTTSRVRVSPQLIRVADGTNVWAHGYDAVLSGVFQIQSDIAEQVAAALDVALAGPERAALAAQPTRNTEAYQYYLRGNEFLNRGYAEEDFSKAVQMYSEAVRLDSTFALAFAQLTRAHDGLYWFDHDRTEQRLALAKAAVDRALLLAPDLPEAHIALGWYLYHGRLDYTGALEQFAIARDRQPNNSDLLGGIGAIQRRQGKWKDALPTLDRAAALDPQSHLGQLEAGITHLLIRDFEEAAKRSDRTILLAPDEPEGYALRARVHLARGHGDSAQQVLRQAADRAGIPKLVRARLFFGLLFLISGDSALGGELERLPREAFGADTTGFLWFRADLNRLRQQPALEREYLDSVAANLEQVARTRPDDWQVHQALGIAYARRGQKAAATREARRAVEQLPMAKDAFFGGNVLATLARIYVIGGEPDSAIPRLDTLLSVPSWLSAGLLRSDPDWSVLQGNARFQRLLAGSR